MSEEELTFNFEITGERNFPPVEIVTPKFRGVAKNFFNLPVQILLDLKAAQVEQTGEEILILFDAAALSFSEEEFEKLQDLTIKEFLEVITKWIYWDRNK